MRRSRAFTLVELLAAVVMLGAIASAGAALLSMASRAAGSRPIEASGWERSAWAALQLMQDDLHAVDIVADANLAVVRVQAGTLRIRTRRSFNAATGDGLTHEYELDRDRHRLDVVESRAGVVLARRPLLNHVKRFEIDLAAAKRTAKVEIESVSGSRLARTFRLP